MDAGGSHQLGHTLLDAGDMSENIAWTVGCRRDCKYPRCGPRLARQAPRGARPLRRGPSGVVPSATRRGFGLSRGVPSAGRRGFELFGRAPFERAARAQWGPFFVGYRRRRDEDARRRARRRARSRCTWGTAGPSNQDAVGVQAAGGALFEAADEALARRGHRGRATGRGGAGGGGHRHRRGGARTCAKSARRSGSWSATWSGRGRRRPARGRGWGRSRARAATCSAWVRDGRAWRAGGWGHLLGDEGSGYWLGVQSIKAALRDRERSGPETALSEAAVEFFDASSVEALAAAVYSKPLTQERDRGVRDRDGGPSRSGGDAVARELYERGAAELAQQIAAVIHRTGLAGRVPGGPDRQRLQGGCGVRRAAHAGDPRARAPEAQVAVVEMAPVGGALLLAARACGAEEALAGIDLAALIEEAVAERSGVATRKSCGAAAGAAEPVRRRLSSGSPAQPRLDRAAVADRARPGPGDAHGGGGVGEGRGRGGGYGPRAARRRTPPRTRRRRRGRRGDRATAGTGTRRISPSGSVDRGGLRPGGDGDHAPVARSRARATRRSAALALAEHHRVAALGQQLAGSSGASAISPRGVPLAHEPLGGEPHEVGAGRAGSDARAGSRGRRGRGAGSRCPPRRLRDRPGPGEQPLAARRALARSAAAWWCARRGARMQLELVAVGLEQRFDLARGRLVSGSACAVRAARPGVRCRSAVPPGRREPSAAKHVDA